MQNLWVMANAAKLSDTNPSAAQFLIDLHNAKTQSEVLQAIDNYDESLMTFRAE